MTTTIVGVFNDFTAAVNTTPDLVGAGFPKEDISVVAQDQKGEYAKFLDAEANPDASSNVGTGAMVGGLGGLEGEPHRQAEADEEQRADLEFGGGRHP